MSRMFSSNVSAGLPKKLTIWAMVAALVVSGLTPFLSQDRVQAATVTQRSITLGSSKVSTATTYAVSFRPATVSAEIEGIVIELCTNSPIIGAACTQDTTFATPADGATVNVNHDDETNIAYTVNAASDQDGLVILTAASGLTNTVTNQPITFTLNVTNKSTIGTFYARILTYSTVAGAAAYSSATPGAHIDDGATALSMANSLQVTAVVQEILEFCVGGTTNNDGTTSIANDCSAAFTGAGSCGNTVGLGILSSTSINTAPVASTSPTFGNDCTGAAMIRTNASAGVNVTYIPEAGSGTNQLRTLRVPGATCDGTQTATDRCINGAGSTQAVFTAGAEAFGMTVAGVNCGSVSATTYTCNAGATRALTRNAEYDGDGSNFGSSAASGFAWREDGVAATIASSTGAVDDEALILHFAATPAATTLTGSYEVYANFVATATF